MAVSEAPLNATLPGLASDQLTGHFSAVTSSTAPRMNEGDAIYYILLVFGIAGAVVVFKMLDNYSTQKTANKLPFDFFEREKAKKRKFFSFVKEAPALIMENRAVTRLDSISSTDNVPGESSPKTVDNV
ncbi:uncharacterized protein LOC144691988 [Cetorhinus maximus]